MRATAGLMLHGLITGGRLAFHLQIMRLLCRCILRPCWLKHDARVARLEPTSLGCLAADEERISC